MIVARPIYDRRCCRRRRRTANVMYFHMDNGAVVTDAFIQFQDMLFIMNYRARKAIQNDEYSGCIILYHMHAEMVSIQ